LSLPGELTVVHPRAILQTSVLAAHCLGVMERMVSPRPILVVEDSQDDAELILKALKRAHVTNDIFVAADGEEALEWLRGTGRFTGRDESTVPIVILLDLKLPKVGGFEVLYQVRHDERTALIPVVILSSSSEDEDIERSYREGANSYVRKQVSFKAFSDCIQLVGRYWTTVNESR
jgi:CheY-like chemotaxis protein